MKALLYYLAQVIVTSGILYAWYHFALRNKKFHRYNRFYLLTATVISITIPFLNIPVYFTQSETDSSFVLQTLTVISSTGSYAPVSAVVNESHHINWFSWQNLSYSFYILIASIALLRIIISLIKIRRIAKNNPVEQLDNIHFVNTIEPGTPFSFFRWLFWNRKIELRSEKGEQIFRHELFHIKQKHSWDIMYMELLTVVLWINPFFHLIKKEVKAIHEFLADQFAITENTKWQYAELLLMQALNTNQRLVNPFFHNQIKRRIAMITTSKKPSYQYLRKLMVFPVAAIVIGLFAFSYKKNNDIKLSDQNYNISGKVSILDTTKRPYSDTIILNKPFASPKRKSPTVGQLKTWSNKEIYGVWIDGRRVSNNDLTNHLPSEFVLYNVSKLEKNAINYGKHYYQVNLFTESYYKKSFLKDSFTYHITQVVKDTAKPINYFEIKIFDIVEIDDPSFPGGADKWRQYLEKNLDGSVPVKKKAPAGIYTVMIQFIVDKEGNISYIKALTNHGFGMEEEAMRVIRLGPKWTPAIQNGHEVIAYKKQPITFVVGKVQNGLILSTNSINTSIPDTAKFKNYLLIVNDKIIGKMGDNFQNTDLMNFVHMNFLDEKAAMEKYGEQGQNGACEIYTLKNSSAEYKNDIVRPGVATVDRIFDKPDTPPSFPGGDPAWKRYLEKNANGLVPLDSGASAGVYKVIVQFTVREDGSVSDIKALTHLGYGMENEAMRVIKSGPKWIPARQNGHIVWAYVQQSVTFAISDEEDNTITIENKTSIFRTKDKKYLTLDPSVLYIGVQNSITIASSEINKEDLTVCVSKGSITGSNGKYIINVHGVRDDVTLTVSTKDGKELGKQVFKVRTIPDQGHTNSTLSSDINELVKQKIDYKIGSILNSYPLKNLPNKLMQ